jgi:transcription antitermination factor NusG
MKKFLAIYLGTPANLDAWRALPEQERKEREKAGFDAWMKWGEDNKKVVADNGAPLGKTKRIDARGISDTKNAMTGYVLVEAESHDEAAKLFRNHPHFTMFPGEAVEIMECLPLPRR